MSGDVRAKNERGKKPSTAFIDGQNLHMATAKAENPWLVDFVKFRRYLREKYGVETAYFFLGYIINELEALYTKIQEAGFILIFREHNSLMLSNKKGNVDTDIVFHIMKRLYRHDLTGKVVLVSNDGDYHQLVDFLIEEKAFLKILHPSQKFASSLYKKLGSEYYDFLDRPDIKHRLAQQKRKAS
jgi:uncharacterized LabA/DUF88 family protein